MHPFYEYKTLLLQTRRETESFYFPLHLHDRLEIMYIHSGTLRLQFLGKEYLLESGDAALIFPYTVHGYTKMSDAPVDYSIVICRSEDTGKFEDMLLERHPANPVIKSALVHHSVPELITELVNLGDSREISTLMTALLQLLLARLIPHLTLKINTVEFESNLIVRLLRYISENYMLPVTLATVSEEFGISRYAVSRLFRDKIHTGFLEYIHSLRNEKAREYLSGTDKRIIDIAYECGYENLRSFNRNFKKANKMSPRQFRNLFSPQP